MFSYFQTRFALPRSTSQAHTPAQWRLLIFFLMPVCCFTHSSLPPPSLTLFLSHLPLWFKSLLDKLSTRNSVISVCLVWILFRQTGWDKFEPLCALLLLLFPLVTLWWQSAEMKPIERSSTSLKFSPLLLCSSVFFMLSRTFFVICSHEESPPFLLNYSSVLAPFSRASVCTFPSLYPHWLNPSPLCTKST